MNVLCLTNLFPLPPDQGGAMRVLGLLRALAKRHSLHVLSLRRAETTREREVELASMLNATVETFDRPAFPETGLSGGRLWARSLLSRTPPWVLAQASPSLRRRAEALTEGFDAVVLLDDYAGVYLPRNGGWPPVVADKHNVLAASVRAAPPRESVRGRVVQALGGPLTD